MFEIFSEPDFQKKLLWVNGAVPALMLLNDFLSGNLGANPPEAVIRTTGVISIIFLVLTLLVTPLVKIFKLSWLVRHRRWLGLWCFYYATLHMISYCVFDKSLNWKDIFSDISKRPFILLGFSGFLILLPLALTSSNAMIKALGAIRWKLLHKFTYLVAPLVTLHYWLIVKSDLFYPILFAISFAPLLLYRFVVFLKTQSKSMNQS